VDAWVSKPSVYVVAARNADHIAAAVTFARENDLRLVVKGGAQAARALGFPFMLTARAHNLMYDNPSLDETTKRLFLADALTAVTVLFPQLPYLVAWGQYCRLSLLSMPFASPFKKWTSWKFLDLTG
jgi:hypothetical protein